MAVFALVVHPTRAEALERAGWLAEELIAGGHEVLAPAGEMAAVGRNVQVAEPAVVAARADLGISLGGDGSMLRAVGMLADAGVPVLGINFGSLGYLTQVEPGHAAAAIQQWLAGDSELELRMRVSVTMPDGASASALNEIVVEKIDSGRTIRVAVSIDADPFHTYEADGVIVATPTGSTAYSLSARGPLVDPTHEALVLTPVAAHTLFDRSLVLSPTTLIALAIEGGRAADVAVDGSVVGRLEPGEQAVCGAAAEPARLVTSGNRRFHQIIKTKFDLSDR